MNDGPRQLRISYCGTERLIHLPVRSHRHPTTGRCLSHPALHSAFNSAVRSRAMSLPHFPLPRPPTCRCDKPRPKVTHCVEIGYPDVFDVDQGRQTGGRPSGLPLPSSNAAHRSGPQWQNCLPIRPDDAPHQGNDRQQSRPSRPLAAFSVAALRSSLRGRSLAAHRGSIKI